MAVRSPRSDGHVHRNVRDQDACLKKSAIHTAATLHSFRQTKSSITGVGGGVGRGVVEGVGVSGVDGIFCCR